MRCLDVVFAVFRKLKDFTSIHMELKSKIIKKPMSFKLWMEIWIEKQQQEINYLKADENK